MNLDKRIERIVTLLDEKKAEEIEVFDLDTIDYIAKRVVIANSLGGKHTQALFSELKTQLKPEGETFLGSDESNDWIVADLGDIIIHIMTPMSRQKYSLEAFLETLRKPEA
jgi:ribosome silencing factor RsfS/YbeB/iojap